MDDKILCDKIKLISDGNESASEAMKDIYLEMKDKIYTFILTRTGYNKFFAEDILHETFLAIYDGAKNFKSFTNPRAWLFTVARNKAVSQIRKLGKTVNADDYLKNHEVFDPSMDDNVNTESILSILSVKDREIVILHVIYGFKHREIAKITGQPLGTVTWRYKKSMDALRKNIAQNENCHQCENTESEVKNT